MRILCLTARLPYPPDRGDRLRAYHFIRRWSAEHELTLVSFVSSRAELARVAALRPFTAAVHTLLQPPWASAWAVARNLRRPLPLQLLYYRARRMQRLVDALLAQQSFDAAYVHLFRMAPYVAHHPRLYRILDLTDVISREAAHSLPYRPPLWRALYTLEQPRIARYERQAARAFDETWLISEVDRRLLAARCPDANLRLVPNGVDCERFRPLGGPPPGPALAFVGNMGVFHNVDAAVFLAEAILPRVRAQLPEATLRLVGAGGHPRVRRLAALPGVTVTGFVEDLNGLLNETAVFLAPLRFSAGVQNKALEALAAGVPVVTTPRVAAGLDALPERDLLVGETADELAAQALRLLHDPALRARLGANGRRFVQTHFRWDHAVARMRAIAACLLKNSD